MTRIKNWFIILMVFCSIQLSSQELLTKKEALKIALENNFGIKLATNNLSTAENNSSIYNSGFLPTIVLNSDIGYRRNNQNIVVTNRDTNQDASIVGNGVVAKTYNASLGLNYVLFDGLGRQYNYKQLKETYNLTELQVKETIENTYLQLFTVYFQIARLLENTHNLKEALLISKQRLKRAAYQYEYGQSTKLDLLNAEVDVNNDSINLISVEQTLANAKRNLTVVLGGKEMDKYDVDTTVVFNKDMVFEELELKVLNNNSLLKQNEINMAISEFNLRVNRSNYLPTLSFNASYGFNRTENENLVNPFGAKLITTDGLNAGLNLTWNVFDGGITKTRVANAKIAYENQKIVQEQQKVTVQNNFRNIFENYKNQLFILQTQEKNVITAQNNFNRTEERFKLGNVTSIEFRQAQINLLNVKSAWSNAKYDAKLLELQLLQLSGDILNMTL